MSKAINADTKQAISTLHEVGAKNLLPIPNKYDDSENLLNYLVFYFLMGLIVYVTYNDLLRLF